MSEKQQFIEILFPYMNRADVNWSKLAKVLGISKTTMSKKIKNPGSFSQAELKVIGNYLNMSLEDRGRIASV